MPNSIDDIFPLAFLLLFPVFWILVVRQLAWSSGWVDLAKSYPATHFDGPKRGFQSAMVGRVQHNSTLIIGADEGGLFLDALLPFRFSHRPLYIPWTAVTRAYREKRYLTNFVVLMFAEQPHATLHLRPRTAKRLQEWSRGNFTFPNDG